MLFSVFTPNHFYLINFIFQVPSYYDESHNYRNAVKKQFAKKEVGSLTIESKFGPYKRTMSGTRDKKSPKRKRTCARTITVH